MAKSARGPPSSPSTGIATLIPTRNPPGLGVDLGAVIPHLKTAWKERRGLVVTPGRQEEKPELNGAWHYAQGVCEAEDLSCFFVTPECIDNSTLELDIDFDDEFEPTNGHLLWYLTRPLPHIQDLVVELASEIQLSTPCAVVHVRHSDRTLNRGWGNLGNESVAPLFSYHPLREYIKKGGDVLAEHGVENLLLLTDDADVVEETKSIQGYEWKYFDKPRFKGSEGGWENHFPADRKSEMIHILALRRLTPLCEVWIGSKSSFASFLQEFGTPSEIVMLDDSN